MKLANITLAPTIRKYNKENLVHDVITGLIIMAVSIPISMGYAQIAGLPAVYGLYGSVFPILLFALFSTSPQFVFGVDAAPAALVGSALLGMNIEGGSKEALAVVPVLTFFVAVWLFAFYLMHAGKLVNYISEPVMGGFITGICTTIILMQVPKLMGGSAGTGEFLELAEHIIKAVRQINMPSLVLGSVSLVILLVAKKLVPKFPMAVVLMVLGAVLTNILPMTAWGIKTLDAVETGLPKWNIPDFTVVPIREVITISLSVAVVIMAETLLAENNFAQKNRYRINDNQEILAFAVGNMAAAFTGCCPINGSVSRTAMGEQYQGKTQVMSIVAGLSMLILLLCGTGMISSHPQYDFNGQPEFVIDAQVFPGSSGSPVYIDLTFENFKNGQIVVGQRKLKLLGIVAMTMIRNNTLQAIPTGTNYITQEVLGLGIVFKSTAIKELVDSMPLN